jgi:hypothetical protein
MAIYKDRVKLSLYEVPEIALSIQNTKGLYEPTNWLPEDDTGRTHFDFYIIPKYRLILDKGLKRGEKVDLSQIKFALA